MRKFLHVCLAMSVFVGAGCAPSDPMAGLSSDDREYLFADTGTNAPFLGQTLDGGPLNCYAQRMNQAYVLIDTERDLWLDSIRPSGIERHKIISITKSDSGFVVKAQNGVSVPFNLILERKGRDMASISWDGAPPEMYRRCESVGL